MVVYHKLSPPGTSPEFGLLLQFLYTGVANLIKTLWVGLAEFDEFGIGYWLLLDGLNPGHSHLLSPIFS
jgi:hypothetical protein